jgi:hypothetical protein
MAVVDGVSGRPAQAALAIWWPYTGTGPTGQARATSPRHAAIALLHFLLLFRVQESPPKRHRYRRKLHCRATHSPPHRGPPKHAHSPALLCSSPLSSWLSWRVEVKAALAVSSSTEQSAAMTAITASLPPSSSLFFLPSSCPS